MQTIETYNNIPSTSKIISVTEGDYSSLWVKISDNLNKLYTVTDVSIIQPMDDKSIIPWTQDHMQSYVLLDISALTYPRTYIIKFTLYQQEIPNNVIYRYLSITLQTDNPEKPYIYMKKDGQE